MDAAARTTDETRRKTRRNLIILGVLVVMIIAWWIYKLEPFRGNDVDLTVAKTKAELAQQCANAYFQNQIGKEGGANFMADEKKTEANGDTFTMHGNISYHYIFNATRTMNDSGPADVTIKLAGDQFEASGARVKGQPKFPGTEQTLKDAKLPKPVH